MPATINLPAPSNLPGTATSILNGCSCAMAPLPLSLISADFVMPQTVAVGSNTPWEIMVMWRGQQPPGVFGLTTVPTNIYESLAPGEEKFIYTQGPYFPATNNDTRSYWGDFTITSLTHTLANNIINFTIGVYNNPNVFVLETGDFVYIRGVTPTAYNRRYSVFRTGANTYTAYHDSATALSAGSVLSGFTVPTRTVGSGLDAYTVPIAGSVMVGSILDSSFKTVPIKSPDQDRIYLVNEFMLARLLDTYHTTASRLSPGRDAKVAARPVARDFNPLSLMETRVDVNCPMHGYQALT